MALVVSAGMGGAGMVVFDIDGGLADMSAFDAVLGPGPRPRAAWQEFFSHLGEAAVVEAGRELVAAVAALGFTVIYSTTRPQFTVPATRAWLAEHGFPAGAALFSRHGKNAGLPAITVKLQHCEVIRRRTRRGYLAAFVDDEPEIVTALREHGYAGRRFARLHDTTTAELQSALVRGPRRLHEQRWSHRGRRAHQLPSNGDIHNHNSSCPAMTPS